MNKPFIYSTEILRSFDILWMVKYIQIAISQMIHTFTGSSNAFVDGAEASESLTPSMTINLTEGVIYQQAAIDPTEWGALDADNTLIIQQGYKAGHSFTLSTSGLSSGQSRWALIEAKFSTVDDIHPNDPTGGVVGFWNAGNPSQPFLGPNNSGASLPTVRFGTMVTQVTYGAPATTGSQTAPTVSSGFVPLYLVLLTNGQTTITNGQILKAGPSVGVGVPSDYQKAPFNTGLYAHHHTGAAGAAPKVSLTTEVEDVLPFGNLPVTNTNPPASSKVPVFGYGTTVPQGDRAGEVGDYFFHSTSKVLYRCSTAGDATGAVWEAIGIPETIFSTATTVSVSGRIHKIYSLRPTANCTFSLDAANLMLGSILTIRNDLDAGATYKVTVDPNATELINGVLSIDLYPGQAITIYPRVVSGVNSWSSLSGPIGQAFGGNGGRQLPTSGAISGTYVHEGNWTSTGPLTFAPGTKIKVQGGTFKLDHTMTGDYGVDGGLGSAIAAQPPGFGSGPAGGQACMFDRCGGGGGGNGGRGGNGGSSKANVFAQGGSAVSIDEFFCGSSGGGGATTGSDAAGDGGKAGPSLYIEVNGDIDINQQIILNGEAGANGTANNGAGGGGGSGGTGDFRASGNIDLTDGGIQAKGGDAGDGGGDSGGHGGEGGAGGGGNVRLWAGGTVTADANVDVSAGADADVGSDSQEATSAEAGVKIVIQNSRPPSRF